MPKNKKLALKLGIQTYQILTNNDEVCIPSVSSILLAVYIQRHKFEWAVLICEFTYNRQLRIMQIFAIEKAQNRQIIATKYLRF